MHDDAGADGRWRNAFSYHPSYYSFEGEGLNYYDIGPQNSRGFRALKVWLALQQAGAAGYREMIQDDIALARHLYDLAVNHPELEAITHHLSITTLRYVPQELRAEQGSPETEEYLNELNRRLLEAIEKSGEAFISNAVIAGKYALRFCIVNFRASTGDIEAMPQLIVGSGRQVHAELNSNAYFGLLFLGYFAAGAEDSRMSSSDGPGWRKPPQLAADRAIVERDCSQPMSTPSANLRCK